MEHALTKKMKELIAAGLKRRLLTTCSKWTRECVVMGGSFPGPINFRAHPWQLEMHDSEAPVNVGQKSAQMGYSTTVINRTFYIIDVEKLNCLYLLPTKTPDATDFSVTKFDAALELSPHLSRLFSSVKNVGVKRAGSSTLWIRGMNSKSALKGIDPSFLVFDEIDEMDEERIPLAEQRVTGHFKKQIWKISTPTVPDYGVNRELQSSTNEHFFFNCPHCSRRTELLFDSDPNNSCLVICGTGLDDPDLKKSHLRCKECKKPLEHGDRGAAKIQWLNDGRPKWEPTVELPNWDKRGFYINQMYSPTVTPVELAEWFFRAQIDLASQQEFYNSKLGLPHLTAGARVSDALLEAAMLRGNGYIQTNIVPPQGFITMGVDVGNTWLHCVICQWFFDRMANDLNVMATCKVICEIKVPKFEDVSQLMRAYQPLMTVVDSEPDYRAAYDFACAHWGRVKLVKYTKGHNSKNINVSAEETHYVTVDRTSWFDLSLGRFHNGRIMLPADTSFEFKQHMKALAKTYKISKKEEADGKATNPKAVYVKTGSDHFAHALNYAEVALPLAASVATNTDIGKFL